MTSCDRHAYGTDENTNTRDKKLQWLYAAHTLQTDLEFYGELYFKF